MNVLASTDIYLALANTNTTAVILAALRKPSCFPAIRRHHVIGNIPGIDRNRMGTRPEGCLVIWRFAYRHNTACFVRSTSCIMEVRTGERVIVRCAFLIRSPSAVSHKQTVVCGTFAAGAVFADITVPGKRTVVCCATPIKTAVGNDQRIDHLRPFVSEVSACKT